MSLEADTEKRSWRSARAMVWGGLLLAVLVFWSAMGAVVATLLR